MTATSPVKAVTEFGDLVSLPKLLARNARVYGKKIAYREKEYGIWQEWTWAEASTVIQELASGLMALGVQPGDHIAVVGRNRPALYWSLLAAGHIGAVPVPLYQDAVAEEMEYVLEHCGAKVVIAEDQEQVDKVVEISERIHNLERVVYYDPRGLRNYDSERFLSFEELRRRGRGALADTTPKMQAIVDNSNFDDVCVMLYTSGTTGKPKGVVLSNRNIITTSANSAVFDHLTHRESTLAYLPMAWVGDFIFSIGQAMWCGFEINCPESAATMQTDMREIGPSYFFAPPRFFETLLTSVMIRMEDAGRLKRSMFHAFMKHARKVGPALLDGKTVSGWDRFVYKLGDILVYGPLKDALGLSRVRIGYTAGEAIGPEIFAFYRSLGINLKQLYGQTEASVFITQQPDGEVSDETVGVVSPGVELKIDERGEVFYRSTGAFEEYYKNPESTRDTKDAEGWVATGDAGFIDEKTGHLRILDRAKDVGKLSNGALFAPKYVENKLKFYPNILEVVVIGADRDMCTAMINIDLYALGNWAERNNIAYASYQELAGHPRVYTMIKSHVEEVNESLAGDEMLSGCQIHRFLVLHKELDADDGELTRTRKVRRRVIEEKFHDLVTALYDGSKEVSTETEVTYEDGRKGSIKARLQIEDTKTLAAKGAAAKGATA